VTTPDVEILLMGPANLLAGLLLQLMRMSFVLTPSAQTSFSRRMHQEVQRASAAKPTQGAQ
jgi:hypothetical protein